MYESSRHFGHSRGSRGVTFCTYDGKDGIFCACISWPKAHFSDVTLKRSFTPLQRGNICIASAYFLTDSHPSVCARFVLLSVTLRACVVFKNFFPYRQDDLHRSASKQTADPCELCADVKRVEARPGGVRPLSIRGLAGAGRMQGEITCITIRPLTGDRNLIPMLQQCLIDETLWWNWSLFVWDKLNIKI